jgi:epoxyqueuosine reductase
MAPPADTTTVTSPVSAATVKAVGLAAGLDAVGVAPAEPFASTRADLHARKRDGLHGGMNFTYRNPDRSTDPARTVRGAAALVVGARGYPPPGREHAGARVAAYATADHYTALRASLGAIADALEGAGWRARVLVDDNALVDREAAYRAGLGWYGKNSNLLLPGRGSWFVLGSVVTDAALEIDEAPVADGCGACTRCMDHCPTGAIVAPGVVDARRCLAWLLQADGDFPIEHRVALGDRIYGCDDCQEVCPPNRRSTAAASDPDDAAVDIIELLALDDETLMARHGRWYIAARDPRFVRRNALVVLGNTAAADDERALATLATYRSDPDDMLRRHAEWATTRVAERSAR